MSHTVFQQISGKHVHYALQLSNILHDGMTTIITTFLLEKTNHTWV